MTSTASSSVIEPPETSVNSTAMEYFATQQIVLVLVGLIGSGKSTLANALSPTFVRCNQDDLGDRRAVEKQVRESLRSGLSVCVDRTNFDQKQRQTWIDIAREVPGVQVWALFLDVSKETCLERLEYRTDHPTIKDFATAQRVLQTFSSQLRPPCKCEGFDLVARLTEEGQKSGFNETLVLSLLGSLAREAAGAEGTIDSLPRRDLKILECNHRADERSRRQPSHNQGWRGRGKAPFRVDRGGWRRRDDDE